MTRQIKKCDKKFAGKAKKRRQAKQRCIEAAKKAAKHKGTNGGAPGAGEPSPGSTAGPTPVQGPGTSSLALTTTELHEGVAGLAYLEQLSATGGVAPYSYAITGLPAGLSGDNSGLITGSPRSTGTSDVGVEVTDAEGAHAHDTVRLDVPTAMPADCMQQTCSHLTPDGETVQIDGSSVTAVSRDPQTEEVTGLSLVGPAPVPQQIIVVSPTGTLPSGLTALVLTATPIGEDETSLTVQQATLGDAYANGTVQALGSNAPAESARVALSGRAWPAGVGIGVRNTVGRNALAGASLNCDSGVSSDLRGLNVKPSLTPSMAAIWHHPLFGGGGFYPGTGGLELFQFDLNGDIQLNMGVSISGKATCTLQLPSLIATIPAGDLGAVVIETTPTLTLKADGKVDTRASITLSCGAEYRWDKGNEYRGSYCSHSYEPLHLAADTGVNVTASGALETAVSLDDIVGVDGTITAALHAGYTPTLHPVAELDASVDYDLGACLVCFWKGSPTRVTIAHGVLYHKTIATYDSAPSPPTDSDIQVEGLDFGTVPAGKEAVEHLTASGGAEPYSFAVSPDPSNVANVPSWVSVESDGTVKVDPPNGTSQSVGFYVYATDATGAHSPVARDRVTFSVGDGGAGMSWTAIGLPVPVGGETGSAFYTFAGGSSKRVACSTAGTCVFAGSYYDTDGFRHSMIETFAGGTWTAIQPPVPAGGEAGSADLSSPLVACSSGNLCLVSGEYRDEASGFTHSLIETFASGTWTAIQPPVPAGGEPGSAWFDTLTCPGAGFCVASGGYGATQGLVETLANGIWTATTAPTGAGEVGTADYSTLACSGPGSCAELGYETYTMSEHTSIETLSSGTWTAIQPPVPAGGEAGSTLLSRLVCSMGGPCVAIGEYHDTGGDDWTGLIETLANGIWTATQPPVPTGGKSGTGTLDWRSLTCSTTSTCVVFGYYHDTSGNLRNMVDSFADGTWMAAEAPAPTGGKAGSLYIEAVACPTADACAAFGSYSDTFGNEHEHDLIETLAGGAWTAIQRPVPVGGEVGSGSLEAELACSVGGSCIGIGEYEDTSGQWRGMIETLAGGAWTAIQRPVPAGGVPTPTSSAPGLACSAVGTCVIIDNYEDTSGGVNDMIETGESTP